MRILLVGEYSNVHWTLAQGLRSLGHDVTVVSDGDGWKDYDRDISLARQSTSRLGGLRYYVKSLLTFRQLKGFDVVQIINPMFMLLKAEKILPFYKKLKSANGKMFMGAFGMDKYWVKAGMDRKTFRYSDFNLGSQLRHSKLNDTYYNDWVLGAKGRLNEYIANDCDGIISGLYEYDASYRPYFADKLCFIPFPIDTGKYKPKVRKAENGVVKFFIGIQKMRSEYKGTDIMLRALRRAKNDFPDKCEVTIAESLPFHQYVKALDDSHVILDQLYSYTPAMNALQAMAQGLVVVGGGEEENYNILGERELRPIVNVQPTEDSVYNEITRLIKNPELIERLSVQSVEYINRYHRHDAVAQRYLDFYNNTPSSKQTP
jgi:glycosyltransferase involved in cell wall biosynthesis